MHASGCHDTSDATLTAIQDRMSELGERCFDVLHANPNIHFSAMRSGAIDKTVHYWRTSELLRHMNRQTSQQLEESAVRGQQILDYEAEMRNPFHDVPEPESPYYRNCQMEACERAKPFAIPAHLRVNQRAVTQACGGCALRIDAVKGKLAGPKSKKHSKTGGEAAVDIEVPRRKEKVDSEAVVKELIVEAPLVPEEGTPRIVKVTEAKPIDSDSRIPPIYGTAELEFGLRNVIQTTQRTINAVKNVRFIVGADAIEYDRHLGALEHLQTTATKFNETFKSEQQRTSRLLRHGNKATPKTDRDEKSNGANRVDSSIATAQDFRDVSSQKNFSSVVTAAVKPEIIEWGRRLELTREKSTTEIGPQFSNVRPEIRTKPRSTYSYEKLTTDGSGFCSATSEKRCNAQVAKPKKKRRSSLLYAPQIRQERDCRQQRADLVIERAKWMQDKVDRRIARSDAKVKDHFKSVMRQKSDTSCLSIN